MRIGGPMSFHAARAYGVARPSHAAAPLDRPIAVAPTAPHDGSEPSRSRQRVDSLVAGRVSEQVDVAGASVQPAHRSDSFALYTRAADRVEAAVGVEIGRRLDVRG